MTPEPRRESEESEMRSMYLCSLNVLIMTLCLAGCTRGPKIIGLEPPSEHVTPEQTETDWWDEMTVDPVDDPAKQPHFIPADEARECPRLTVSTFSGMEGGIEPGRMGDVTLVVFWSMDVHFTKAAMRHVSEMADKYADRRVKALGIVEGPTAGHAPAFLKAQDIDCPVYCDDFSALREMGKAAAQGDAHGVPWFFILDRYRRVRFSKRGFSCTVAAVTVMDVLKEEVIENAAEGERIEDYLARILAERR